MRQLDRMCSIGSLLLSWLFAVTTREDKAMKQRLNGTHARVWNSYNRAQDAMCAEIFRQSREARAASSATKVVRTVPTLAAKSLSKA